MAARQLVRRVEVARQVPPVDAVVLLRGKQVGAVVAKAPLARELHDRERLERVDAEVGEVLDPPEHVQELRDPILPPVMPLLGTGVEAADVQLIDDEIGDRRRLEVVVVPWVGVAGAHDPVGIRVVVQLELTSPRVALKLRAARALDVEAVQRPVAGAGEEARP